jgi:hypothetical protein
MRSPRSTAVAALVITSAGAVYAAVSALASWEPSVGWLLQAAIHVGELLAVMALVRVGAAGTGRAGRTGLGLAILGQATMAVAEVLWPIDHGLGDILFGVAPVLTGVGMIIAGVVTVRAGRLSGWQRFLPLTLGLFIFAVMTPVLIVSGGPPAPAALWVIVGWDLLWALIASSTLTRAAEPSGAGPRRVEAELH